VRCILSRNGTPPGFITLYPTRQQRQTSVSRGHASIPDTPRPFLGSSDHATPLLFPSLGKEDRSFTQMIRKGTKEGLI